MEIKEGKPGVPFSFDFTNTDDILDKSMCFAVVSYACDSVVCRTWP